MSDDDEMLKSLRGGISFTTSRQAADRIEALLKEKAQGWSDRMESSMTEAELRYTEKDMLDWQREAIGRRAVFVNGYRVDKPYHDGDVRPTRPHDRFLQPHIRRAKRGRS